jgi:hypothetical protein
VDTLSAMITTHPGNAPGTGGATSPRPSNANAGAAPNLLTASNIDVATVMEDPVSLMLMLSKHRESLNLTLREINALKAVIQGQEQAIGKLMNEKEQLLQQLAKAKDTEFELVAQIQQLTVTCEELSQTIQRRGVETAARINAVETQKRESELIAKTMIDRLQTQLLSTQHPLSSARPLPWNRIQSIEGHPAIIIKEIVLADARREENMMGRPMTVNQEDDFLEKLKEQSRIPTNRDVRDMANLGTSEDEAMWRIACGRLYQVLHERRNFLHTSVEQSPVEFLLRTRHQLVAEVCHLHKMVNRCASMVSVLFDRLEGIISSYGGQAIGGQLELVAASVADMDSTLHRAKLHCFSTVDCVMHNVNTLGVGPSAFTPNTKPLLRTAGDVTAQDQVNEAAKAKPAGTAASRTGTRGTPAGRPTVRSGGHEASGGMNASFSGAGGSNPTAKVGNASFSSLAAQPGSPTRRKSVAFSNQSFADSPTSHNSTLSDSKNSPLVAPTSTPQPGPGFGGQPR